MTAIGFQEPTGSLRLPPGALGLSRSNLPANGALTATLINSMCGSRSENEHPGGNGPAEGGATPHALSSQTPRGLEIGATMSEDSSQLDVGAAQALASTAFDRLTAEQQVGDYAQLCSQPCIAPKPCSSANVPSLGARSRLGSGSGWLVGTCMADCRLNVLGSTPQVRGMLCCRTG